VEAGRLSEGQVAPELAAEFPGLRLVWADVPAAVRRSPPELRHRLEALSDRFSGPRAIMLRREPIPHAYRVFFRHIGLDPDVDRIPAEALAVERLTHGGFRSRNTLDDGLTIALAETGVGLWALDADGLEGPLELRPSRAGEPLGRAEHVSRTPAGRLVVADRAGPVAVLFSDVVPGRGVTRRTRRIRLFAVLVEGVPDLVAEEAVWLCEEVLTDS
jgi:DNA/RNA-binding domain of Phe-tRNA-synthetase-like protein